MRAYHFLPETWALEALVKQRIKISILNDLNDPFELLNFEISEQANQTDWQKTISIMSKSTGVLCFSKDWSNPLLWSHYADQHKGICLGFDISEESLEKIEYRNCPIPYDEIKVIFDGDMYKENPNNEKQEIAMKKILLTKYEGWRYEDEVRCFASLEDSEDGKYFLDFTVNSSTKLTLKEIILGVRCKINEKRINDCVQCEVELIKAGLDSKSFKVVRAK